MDGHGNWIINRSLYEMVKVLGQNQVEQLHKGTRLSTLQLAMHILS